MRKNKIQQSLHCAECVEKGLAPSLGIGFDDDDRLIVVCCCHEARLLEFKLKDPKQVQGCEQAICAKCEKAKVGVVKIDVGVTGDGQRLIVACTEHGTMFGAFELAEPITPEPCPDCGEGAVGTHAHRAPP